MTGLSLYVISYVALALGPPLLALLGLLLRHPQLLLILSAAASLSYLLPVFFTSIVHQILGGHSVATDADKNSQVALGWIYVVLQIATRILFAIGLVRTERTFRFYGQTLSSIGGEIRSNFAAIGGAAGLGFGFMHALLRIGSIATVESDIVLNYGKGRDPVGIANTVPTVWWDRAVCNEMPKGPYEAAESLLRTACEVLWMAVAFYGVASMIEARHSARKVGGAAAHGMEGAPSAASFTDELATLDPIVPPASDPAAVPTTQSSTAAVVDVPINDTVRRRRVSGTATAQQPVNEQQQTPVTRTPARRREVDTRAAMVMARNRQRLGMQIVAHGELVGVVVLVVSCLLPLLWMASSLTHWSKGKCVTSLGLHGGVFALSMVTVCVLLKRQADTPS